MPSDNTGKQIVAVKPSKKKVWLYLSDGEKLALAPSVFSDFYLYVGKNLSEKDYRHLKNENEIGSLREYAYALVAVRSYTGKQIADRLYKKKATRAMVEAIVQDLTNHQLIDDDRYVEDFLELSRDRHYGEYKIKQELIRDGISEAKIAALRFDEDDEYNKGMDLLPSFEKKFEKISFRERKKRIYEGYMLRGYSPDTIEKILAHVSPKDEESEITALKRDYDKAMRLYSARYQGRQLKEHLIRNLMQKGYNYTDIETMMEEAKHVMDQ